MVLVEEASPAGVIAAAKAGRSYASTGIRADSRRMRRAIGP